jgi:hypothetical protein
LADALGQPQGSLRPGQVGPLGSLWVQVASVHVELLHLGLLRGVDVGRQVAAQVVADLLRLGARLGAGEQLEGGVAGGGGDVGRGQRAGVCRGGRKGREGSASTLASCDVYSVQRGISFRLAKAAADAQLARPLTPDLAHEDEALPAAGIGPAPGRVETLAVVAHCAVLWRLEVVGLLWHIQPVSLAPVQVGAGVGPDLQQEQEPRLSGCAAGRSCSGRQPERTQRQWHRHTCTAGCLTAKGSVQVKLGQARLFLRPIQ